MGFGRGGVNRPKKSAPRPAVAAPPGHESPTNAATPTPRELSHCGQQTRPPSLVRTVDSRRRGRDFTDAEKTYMLAMWGLLLTDRHGNKIGVET